MDLLEYLNANDVEQPLPRSSFETFESLEPQDLSETLSQQRPALRMSSVEALQGLIIHRFHWLDWRGTTAEVNAAREADGLELLAPSQHQVFRADEVRALDWATRTAGDDAELASALLRLYRSLVTASTTEASVTIAVGQPGHVRAAQFAKLVGPAGTTGEMDPERWFEVVRGVRLGALKFELTLPWESVATADGLDGLSARQGETAPAEYVEQELASVSSYIEGRLTADFEDRLLRMLSERYHELLSAEPIRAHPLGAIYIGTDRQRVGMVVLDKKGGIAATAPVRPSGDWAKRSIGWMKQHRVRMVVVPSTALAQKWLDELSMNSLWSACVPLRST